MNTNLHEPVAAGLCDPTIANLPGKQSTDNGRQQSARSGSLVESYDSAVRRVFAAVAGGDAADADDVVKRSGFGWGKRLEALKNYCRLTKVMAHR